MKSFGVVLGGACNRFRIWDDDFRIHWFTITSLSMNVCIACVSYPMCVAPYTQEGCTPLIKAAEKGHIDIVDTLLKAGADKNAKTKVMQNSRTPRDAGSSVTLGLSLCVAVERYDLNSLLAAEIALGLSNGYDTLLSL